MKRSDHQIIQRVLDGEVSADEFAAFQQQLRTDESLAKHYGEYALLHHSLCEEFGDKPLAADPAPVRRIMRTSSWWWILVVAALAVAAVVSYQRFRPKTVFGAVHGAPIEFSADAVWRVENGGTGGSLTRGATLHLACGQARVVPTPGFAAVIEGPAALTYVSPEALHLAGGRGRFRLDDPQHRLEVSTSAFSVTASDTDFAIDTSPSRPHEVHVLKGSILLRINGIKEPEVLTAGKAARTKGKKTLTYFSADGTQFPAAIREFQTVLSGKFEKSSWRVSHGNPSITADRIEGVNFAAFQGLARPVPDDAAPILLVTLDAGRPPDGMFHTDGWAGFSLYNNGEEGVFFGDSFGPEQTWSLDVKQRVPVILPANPIVGARTVTLRYDRRTGAVSLHEGVGPLGPPFCSGLIPTGMTFDEIRLAASADAALAVRAITIRAGG